jgi:signal transduction histidine kinase
VTLAARREGDKAVLTVNDAGIGIAKADQEAIFEPFFRSAQARQEGIIGTGLGLAIVARISDALGGKISCQSTLGQGSEFSLFLPIETALSTASPIARDSHLRT